MSRLLLAALMLAPLFALAQSPGANIYRTTDAQGNVVFTDTPPGDARSTEAVEVQPVNTAEPPPDLPPATAPAPRQPASADTGYRVIIVEPADETTIPMGPGNFAVTARVVPDPGGDTTLQLFVDGEPYGERRNEPSWQLTNIFRGAHDITVAVVDDDSGETLAMSEPVRVYVLRPSINFRQ